MIKPITLLAALLAIASTAAFADGDIVYSARYYSPAPAKPSSFHLYRIDPDGAGRKQITTGRHDDRDPQWSPDGKSILFVRDNKDLCTVDADGRKLRTLAAFGPDPAIIPPLADAKWWPDSHAVIIPIGPAKGSGKVVDASSGRTLSTLPRAFSLAVGPEGDRAYVEDNSGGFMGTLNGDSLYVFHKLPVPIVAAAWVSDNAFVGIISTDGDASDRIIGFDDNGTRLWTRDVHPVRPTNSDLGVSFRAAVAIPNDYREVILGEDISTSTVRPDYNYYRTSVDTGNAPLWLSSKQFLIFGKSNAYVTSSAKDLTDYGPKKHGRQPQVWTADLEIGRSPDDTHPKPIVHGLVWVDSADWRRDRDTP